MGQSEFSRGIGPALAETLVLTFLSAVLAEEDRHVRRLGKVSILDAAHRQGDVDTYHLSQESKQIK